MTEYRTIYEQNADGWWAHAPDLPGCTAFGATREEVERNMRSAVEAHIDLLRKTGRSIPDPTTRTTV